MRRISIFAALVLSFIVLAANASATVLFSNLNANNSSTSSATILSSSNTLAANFTVPSGGPYLLSTLELVVANFNNPPNTIAASIRADNSGKPGTTLESFSFTGDLGDSNSPTTQLFNSTLHPPLLSGATYWIAVLSGNPNNSILWKNNSVGDDRNAMFDFGNTNTWQATADADPAFRVSGVIPEPTAMALLSLVPFVLRRRR